jgi:hypothetical protein
MDPDKKRNLIIIAAIFLMVLLAVCIWYNSAYSYRPGETIFHLSLTQYYSNRIETIKVEYDMLSIDSRTVPSLSGTTEYHELTKEQVRTFSDYIVRKKRFFLSLDSLMTAKEPNEITRTNQYIDRPYKYEIRVRFNELDRTVTDYDYSKTERMMDLRHFILEMADDIRN